MSPAVDDAPLVRDDSGQVRDEDVVIRDKPTSKQRARRIGCIILFLLLGLVFVAAVIVLVLLLVMVGGEAPRVELDCGVLQGRVDVQQHVYSFLGVPFAMPPTNELRWQPPKPLNKTHCWEGTYVASEHAPQCAQFYSDNIGKEDCLYLDVYTPSIDSEAKLPVIVYIHGGYLLFANNSMVGYAPSAQLADKLNVVFVSIQYRLNAFGFMVIDELPGTGNYGFLDQIEALKWVKTNIDKFGGDPDQVTLYGQSSGGTSVWTLMMSPLAKGLFHRAWSTSGSPLYTATLEEAKKKNVQFVNLTKCTNDTKSCLMKLSTEDIVEVAQKMYEWHILDCMDLPEKGSFNLPLAVVDGNVMPKAPFEMWKETNGSYNDVPFMIDGSTACTGSAYLCSLFNCTTAREVDSHPGPGEVVLTWDEAKYTEYVKNRLDLFGSDIGDKAIDMYNTTMTTETLTPQYQFTTMTSDLRVNCGSNKMAEKASAALKSGVYRYIVTSEPSSPVNAWNDPFPAKYAFHGWDCFAFFGIEIFMTKPPKDTDLAFADLVTENVMSFVKTGKPKDPEWIIYPNTTALLSSTISFTENKFYHEEECEFWEQYGLLEYSWIN